MKIKESKGGSGLPVRQKQNEVPSRRRFLQAAATVGAVAATAPIAGLALTPQSPTSPEPSPELEDPMEKVLSRYGSEFGNLNRVG